MRILLMEKEPTATSRTPVRRNSRRLAPIAIAFTATLLGGFALPAPSRSEKWNKDADEQKWSVKTNWDPQTVPDGANAIATLGNVISADRTIVLDQDVALKALQIDSGKNYTIVGTAGQSFGFATNSISVTNNNGNGAHAITVPVSNFLGRPLVVSVVDTNAAALTLDVVSGDGGLTKTGAGTLVLGARSTYTGDTQVMAGTLKLGNAVALPSGTNLSVAAGATFDLDGGSRPSVSSLSGAGTVTSSTGQAGIGILTVGGSSNSQFDGVLSGHLSLVKSGDGTLTLTKAATYDGSTDINAGTNGKGGIVIGVDNALPTGTSLVLNGTLDLGGAANKNGFNQTVARLRGLNGVIVNNGGADVTFTVSSPGNNDGFAGKIQGNLNFVKDGANTLTLAGENNYRGTTTVKAGTLRIDSDGSLPDGARVTLQNTATLDFKGTEQTLGSLDGTANTSVKNSGIFAFELRVSPPANTTSTFAGQISGNLSLTMGGGGTLILTGSNTYGNKGEVSTTVSGGGTLTVNNKAGSGTGAGDVRVANGKLDGTGTIDGKVSTGNAGMVGNKLTINGGVETDGGKIGVGDTPGRLTIAQGLAMSAGGTYAWQLGALSEANPGTDFSFISLTSGMLALGANTTISLEFLNGTTPAAGVGFWAKSHTWDVIALANKNQNPNSTNFGSLENARFDVGEFTTALGGPSGADILLKFTPTTLPEPPALVMFGLGLSALVAFDRLRRRQVAA